MGENRGGGKYDRFALFRGGLEVISSDIATCEDRQRPLWARDDFK